MLLDQITGRLVVDGSRRCFDYTQVGERAASDMAEPRGQPRAAIKPFRKIAKLRVDDLCGWG